VTLPPQLRLSYNRFPKLRSGENPYQEAVFYNDPYYKRMCVHNSIQLQGKELSYNNIVDINAALGIVMDFEEPTSAIIKHTSPCGMASDKNLRDAYENAYKSDSVSAYGSIVGFNKPVDVDTAEAMRKRFIDCIIAPDYMPEALEILKKKKKTRVMKVSGSLEKGGKGDYELVRVRGGALLQTANFPELKMSDLKYITDNKPTDAQLKTMFFAWKAIKHIKSNGIILAKDTRTVGIGSGLMSRIDAAIIACRKAGEEAKGAVMASDAFFPFRDCIDEAAKVGVTAVIQPGGSIRDPEVIEAVKEHKMSMVFTGYRLFKH
jgi:phosphoribosylaminoimidazolecarboxamide formyltransferase/IMP cyclohydrolase